jgi:hypothetical protein
MRANVYSRYDREVMVSKYSQKLARLYKAQVDLYKLIIEDAETSQIEAAVSRVATLSFELTQMPDIPETMKEWHERIMEKAFPKNAISGSPNSVARHRAAAATAAGAHRQPRKRACQADKPARRPAGQARPPAAAAVIVR